MDGCGARRNHAIPMTPTPIGGAQGIAAARIKRFDQKATRVFAIRKSRQNAKCF
jgi:hypothetical protein